MHTTREVAACQRMFMCKAAGDAAGSAAAGQCHLQGWPLLKGWGLRLRRICMDPADLVLLVSLCPADAATCQLSEIPRLSLHLSIVRVARYCLLHCFKRLQSFRRAQLQRQCLSHHTAPFGQDS